MKLTARGMLIIPVRAPGGGIYILYNIYKSPPPPAGTAIIIKDIIFNVE